MHPLPPGLLYAVDPRVEHKEDPPNGRRDWAARDARE